MEEVIKEQIEYVLNMIEEQSDESKKNSLLKILDMLIKLNASFRVENLDIIEERLNTTIEFIESIKSALEDMEGPIDEETQETIDGIDILISGLKTSLSARSIR